MNENINGCNLNQDDSCGVKERRLGTDSKEPGSRGEGVQGSRGAGETRSKQ